LPSRRPTAAPVGQTSGEIGMLHWTSGLTPLVPADYTSLAVPFVECVAVIVKPDAPYASIADFVEAYRRGPVRG
jgi:hypothetical protein